MKAVQVISLLVFISFQALAFAQDVSQSDDVPGAKEKKTALTNEKDAIAEFNEKNPNIQERPTEVAGPGFWGPFIFLLIVIGILYVVLKYIRKKKNPSINDFEFMQSLGHVSLASGSHLEIVEIGEKVYLLGVGSGSVNLLFEIEDKDLILKLKARPLSPKHKSFLDIVGHVFEKKGQPIKVDIQKGFMDFIKQQKDRLKKLK